MLAHGLPCQLFQPPSSSFGVRGLAPLCSSWVPRFSTALLRCLRRLRSTRFLDYSGVRHLAIFPYSGVFGSTVDKVHASLHALFALGNLEIISACPLFLAASCSGVCVARGAQNIFFLSDGFRILHAQFDSGDISCVSLGVLLDGFPTFKVKVDLGV